MGSILTTAEIIRTLKLHMPVHVSYPDPFGGPPVVCQRDDVLRLLVVNSSDIIHEGQYVAALYAEMGRLASAAEFAAEFAEAEYKRWQASVSAAFRAQREKSGGKGPTVAEVEDHYRAHAEYEAQKTSPLRFKAQARIFEDLREAFNIKHRIIAEHSRVLRGYEQTLRTENNADELQNVLNTINRHGA